ncbi:hypothetical protein [Oryza sativa Japonica Group]|uniref:Uncharacterized protein n=1 Tax=Oryza sativa subsp. japonica TaxID=39947 RepID=Q5JLR5_ORYSJ|nr:hypothetical protein [Oryza sativa Japonica Group]
MQEEEPPNVDAYWGYNACGPDNNCTNRSLLLSADLLDVAVRLSSCQVMTCIYALLNYVVVCQGLHGLVNWLFAETSA